MSPSPKRPVLVSALWLLGCVTWPWPVSAEPAASAPANRGAASLAKPAGATVPVAPQSAADAQAGKCPTQGQPSVGFDAPEDLCSGIRVIGKPPKLDPAAAAAVGSATPKVSTPAPAGGKSPGGVKPRSGQLAIEKK